MYVYMYSLLVRSNPEWKFFLEGIWSFKLIKTNLYRVAYTILRINTNTICTKHLRRNEQLGL